MSTKKLNLSDLIKCNQLEQIVIIGGLYDKYKDNIFNYIKDEFSQEELGNLKTKLITQLTIIENNTLDFINDMNQQPKLNFNKYNKLFPHWENCNEILNNYIDENFDVRVVFEYNAIRIFNMKPFTGIPLEYINTVGKIVHNYNAWFVDTLKINNLLKLKCNQDSLDFIKVCINKKMDEFETNHGYHVKDVLKRMLNITYEKSEYKRKSSGQA